MCSWFQATQKRKTILLFAPKDDVVLSKEISEIFDVVHLKTLSEAAKLIRNTSKSSCVDVVISKLGVSADADSGWKLCTMIRDQLGLRPFFCFHSFTAAENPRTRIACFDAGANMVTNDMSSLTSILLKISKMGKSGGAYSCPYCDLRGLTEDELCEHCPMYHVNHGNVKLTCPICRKMSDQVFQVHLHNFHGPVGRHEAHSDFRARTPLYSFALVVCHRKSDNKFLLVQEFANSGFWLPGGAIDPGEDPKMAAIRETEEEAGIQVRLTGVLRFEYSPVREPDGASYVRMRIIFLAEPVDESAIPKSCPDYESCGATWATAEQVAELARTDRLRGPEPAEWIPHVLKSPTVAPISILDNEGASPPLVPSEHS